MTLNTESIADQTYLFADVFVRENIAYKLLKNALRTLLWDVYMEKCSEFNPLSEYFTSPKLPESASKATTVPISVGYLLFSLTCISYLWKKLCTVNVLKFQTLFYVCSPIKCWLLGLEFTQGLSEQQSGKTLIRLLLQKQSDLGLPCLSRPFWAGNSVFEILEHLP